MIQIRNVPDALPRKLKGHGRDGRHVTFGLSAELRRTAEVPTLAELEERLSKLPPVSVEIDTAQMVRQARESR